MKKNILIVLSIIIYSINLYADKMPSIGFSFNQDLKVRTGKGMNYPTVSILSPFSKLEIIKSDFERTITINKNMIIDFNGKSHFLKKDQIIKNRKILIHIPGKNLKITRGYHQIRTEDDITGWVPIEKVIVNSNFIGNHADTFFNKGNFQKAINLYTKGISLDSKNYILYNNRGIAYLKIKNFTDAKIDLNKTLLLTKDVAIPTYNLACLNSLKGNNEKACRYFADAIEKGYNSWNAIKGDPDLNNIRNRSCYKEIMMDKQLSGIKIIQNNRIIHVNDFETITLNKKPFSLNFIVKDYSSEKKEFNAAQITTYTDKSIFNITTNMKTKNSKFFSGGSGYAGREGQYNAMVIGNYGNHYIMYEPHGDKRGKLIKVLNDKRKEIQWTIKKIFYNDTDIQIENMEFQKIYFTIFIDYNRNEIMEINEFLRFVIKFK